MEYNVTMGTIDQIQLSNSQNKILYALMNKEVLSNEQINQILGNNLDSRTGTTHIFRMKKLLHSKLKILNKRHYGYFINQEDKEKIKIVSEPISKRLSIEIAEKIVEEMTELEKDIAAERLEMAGYRLIRIKELQKQLNEKIKLIYS